MKGRWISVAFVTLATGTVLACGKCFFAAFDAFMPPVYLWTFISLSWFICSGVVLTCGAKNAAHISCCPGLFGVLLISVSACAIGFVGFGPIPMFILGIAALVTFLCALVLSKHRNKGIVLVGLVHLVLYACAIIPLRHVKATRSEVEYMDKWEAIGARYVFQRLKAQEPDSLPRYRAIIISSTDGDVLGRAATRIAAISSNEADAVLLEQALARIPRTDYDHEIINEALVLLKDNVSACPVQTTNTTER